ncbi:helix-turn-helix domain-containing protein [Sulfurimonas sp. NW15]|uniref:helix-turn-helix domain-containing protein n=1 Tax=Sulfurimonas sp. NW15 TaxID=2922729 RepID=UPI003DA82C54
MKNEFSNTIDEEIEDFYKRISKNVKFFRINKGVTQLDLALDIGIKSVAFYSNCENNKYNKHFNLEHLYKIAKALQINICDLISV